MFGYNSSRPSLEKKGSDNLEAYDWRSGKEIKKDENTDQI
jgi:hypothetical protein